MAITFLNVKFISCFVIHTPQLHIDIDFSFPHEYIRNRNSEIKTKHTSKRTHTVNYSTVCIQFNIVQFCWIRRISFKMSKNDLFICEIPSHNVFFSLLCCSLFYTFFPIEYCFCYYCSHSLCISFVNSIYRLSLFELGKM